LETSGVAREHLAGGSWLARELVGGQRTLVQLRRGVESAELSAAASLEQTAKLAADFRDFENSWSSATYSMLVASFLLALEVHDTLAAPRSG
jgi:hypothetical protein